MLHKNYHYTTGTDETLVTAFANQLNSTYGFTPEELNVAIQQYQFDEIEKFASKPVGNFSVNDKTRVVEGRESGAAWRILISRLPFIIFAYKPSLVSSFDSELWHLISIYIALTAILQSPIIFKSDLKYYETLVKQFIYMARTLGLTIVPKIHNLLHYKRQIYEYGNAKAASCAIFERGMRDVRLAIKSYKNMIKQILRFASFQSIYYVDDYLSESSYLEDLCCLAMTTKNALKEYSIPIHISNTINLPRSLSVVTSVSLHGTLFRENVVIMADKPSPFWCTQDYLPTFRLVRLIYMCNKQIYALVQHLTSLKYHSIASAFAVAKEDNYSVVELTSLPIHRSFSFHNFDGVNYVIVDSIPFFYVAVPQWNHHRK